MRRRAFSLVEVLVASGLGLLMLIVLGTCFSAAWRAWNQAQALSTAQRSTLKLSYRLRADYTAAMPGSLSLSVPNQISFLSDDAMSWDDTGSPQWSHWVQYRFTPGAGTVERRVVTLAAPTQSASAMPVWPASTAGTLLGEAVTMFSVDPVGPSCCLTVHIRTQSQQSSSRVDLGLLPLLYGQD